ncbi:WYL domain-containing protein [Streptomyces sp. NPDC088746]|uniref:WYL domain-containing protein n=1 Tax=Streptomyces sp. NPDC088746 TaxID=3365885 RepID=UPI0037FF8746
MVFSVLVSPCRRRGESQDIAFTQKRVSADSGRKRPPRSTILGLAHAIDAGTAITVEYVAASNNRTVRTLSELVLDPPYLYAWCHLRDDERVFTLSRIHGVMPG